MLQPKRISKREQAKNLLLNFIGKSFNYSYVFPLLYFAINALGTFIMWLYLITDTEPAWLTYLDVNLGQISKNGLLSLITLLFTFPNWRKISWVFFFALCVMFIADTIHMNIIYPINCNEDAACVKLRYERECNYFYFYLVPIYSITLIYALLMLRKRKY